MRAYPISVQNEACKLKNYLDKIDLKLLHFALFIAQCREAIRSVIR